MDWKSKILDVISKLKVEYKDDKIIISNKKGRHNIDFPATIIKRPDGTLKYLGYFEDGNQHRLYGKPAIMQFRKSGKFKLLGYYVNNMEHRIKRPTFKQCMDPNNIDNVAHVIFHKNGKVSHKSYIRYGNYIVATISKLLPCSVGFYESGKLKMVRYEFEDDEEIPPEWIATESRYYENGIIQELRYATSEGLNNVPSRYCDDRPILPAIRKYYKTGLLSMEIYVRDDHKHRSPEEGPALIEYHPNGNIRKETYFINNIKSNPNGPCSIHYDTNGIKTSEKHYVLLNKNLKKILRFDKEGNIILVEYK